MNKLDERFWYTIAAIIALVEFEAIRHERQNGTISYAARKVGRCHTRSGRAFTSVAIIATAAWLVPHLTTMVDASIESLSRESD